MQPELSMHCARCGAAITAEETLCCETASGSIIASSYIEIRRLLRARERVELFHLRCASTAPSATDTGR